MLRVVPPRLIAIGGYSGSGKSTLAGRLAPTLGVAPGAVVLRTDTSRKQLLSADSESPLPDSAYTADAREAIYARMYREAEEALRGGYTVIADAVFNSEETRSGIEAVAARLGVPFAGLWLDADVAELERRITARRGDASDATVAVLHQQLRSAVSAQRWRVIDARGRPAETERRGRAALLHGHEAAAARVGCREFAVRG
jgi:predicted kinase